MLAETARRRIETLGEVAKDGKRINGLFRLIEYRPLWFEAYAHIYPNTHCLTGKVTQGELLPHE